MAAEIVVSAQSRSSRGKNEARRLRAKGMIPAVVYGGKSDAVAVAVDPKTLLKVLRSEAGRNTILSLDLGDGGKTSAILKSWQVDPVNERFIHADFYRIAMDVALKVKVPIHAVGEARGVKVDAGILEIIMREVEVECLPGDIPERIDVDVSDLGIHGAVRVSDLKISDKVSFGGITMGTVVALVAYHLFRVVNNPEDGEQHDGGPRGSGQGGPA